MRPLLCTSLEYRNSISNALIGGFLLLQRINLQIASGATLAMRMVQIHLQ